MEIKTMTKTDNNAIKGIAILLMIFYHLFYSMDLVELGTYTGLLFSAQVTQTLAKACHVCVPLFVFVTGYGLSCIEKQKTDLQESYQGSLKRYFSLVSDQAYIIIVLMFITYICGFSHTAEDVWGGDLLRQIVGVLANATGTAGFLQINWFCDSWWYLGLAVAWIFLVPVLYRSVKYMGPIAAGSLGILLPSILSIDTSNDNVGRYLPVLIFGIIWAAYDVDQKIMEFCKRNKLIWFGLMIGLLIFMPVLIVIKGRVQANYLVELVFALDIVVFSRLCFEEIGFLKSIFAFLGEQSKYMWLIHVFIFRYWFYDLFFGLNNIWLIFTSVVCVTLLAAWILNMAKGFLVSLGRVEV